MTFEQWWNNKRKPLIAPGLTLWEMERVRVISLIGWVAAMEEAERCVNEYMRTTEDMDDIIPHYVYFPQEINSNIPAKEDL